MARGGGYVMPILNTATPEGRELGRHIARFCDQELAGKPDNRCGTCAGKSGDHLANGSPVTLIEMCAQTPRVSHGVKRTLDVRYRCAI